MGFLLMIFGLVGCRDIWAIWALGLRVFGLGARNRFWVTFSEAFETGAQGIRTFVP